MGGACTEVRYVTLYIRSYAEYISPPSPAPTDSSNPIVSPRVFFPLLPRKKQIDHFPNATIAEYGEISMDVNAIMAEIYARGPVAATINAEPIVKYRGGVYKDKGDDTGTNHIVSIVGWGTTATDADDEGEGEEVVRGGKKKKRKNKKHWIVRNSWGQYWGEMGYIRVEMGKNVLGLESAIAWATPGSWTEDNYKCDENGDNCNEGRGGIYVDPSGDVEAVKRRIREKM